MNNYVFNHDYGYGKEPEVIELNKLKLRNIIDLKDYIVDLVNVCYVAEIANNIIRFLDDNIKIEIIV